MSLSSGSSSPTTPLLAPKVAWHVLPKKKGQTQAHAWVFIMDMSLSSGFTCLAELLSTPKVVENNLQTKKTQA
jgi:hypothetical protein